MPAVPPSFLPSSPKSDLASRVARASLIACRRTLTCKLILRAQIVRIVPHAGRARQPAPTLKAHPVMAAAATTGCSWCINFLPRAPSSPMRRMRS